MSKEIQMKVKEFIELISKTQDNDVLMKEFSEDDYLSLLLMKIVQDNTDKASERVDVNAFHNDLSYASDQLYKALVVVQNLIFLEEN